MKLSNDRRIRLKNTVVSDLIEKSRVTNQEKITHLPIFHYFSLSNEMKISLYLISNIKDKKGDKKEKKRKIKKGKSLLRYSYFSCIRI